MKKILSVVLLAIMFVVSQNKFAFAADYYVGNFLNGNKAFLMTETIEYIAGFRDVKARVKSVDSRGRLVSYIDYELEDRMDEGFVRYKSSEGFAGVAQNGSVEFNVYHYAYKKWSDYVVNGHW